MMPIQTNQSQIGKLTDVGVLVSGGKIDEFWGKKHRIDTQLYTGIEKQYQFPFLYDANIALKHFNLRSIEFGNWVSQEERANMLYASMLGFHQLALILNIKPHLIGMGGKLSIALGARGEGRANAHYERLSYAIINITKTRGFNGSLAHEFAHAFDNIIGYYTNSSQTFVTGGSTTRKGYEEAIAEKGNYFDRQMEELFNELFFDSEGEQTSFRNFLDTEGEYLNRRLEIFARLFESYVGKQQRKRKLPNKYLAKLNYSHKAYPNPKLLKKVEKRLQTIFKKGFEVMEKEAPSLKGVAGGTNFLSPVDYKGFRTVISENASLDEVLDNIKRIAVRDSYQVAELAEHLEGNSVRQTCSNIWHFIRQNLRYKLDEKGEEQLRTPSRTITDRIFDCDDNTILVSAMLLHLDIEHEYRVTAYQEKGQFEHIYPVAFNENGQAIIIDTVPEIPRFNYEEQPIIDLKTVTMKLVELSGINDSLSEHELINDYLNELQSPFKLEDNENEDELLNSQFLQGLGEVSRPEKADVVIRTKAEAVQLLSNGILAEVVKAKESLEGEQKKPGILSQLVNVDKEVKIMDQLIKVWRNSALRESTLVAAIQQQTAYKNFYIALKKSLEELTAELSMLNGVEETTPIYLAKMDVFEPQDFLNDESEIRNDQPMGGFLKKAFKKVKNTVKKTVKAVVRYNPATIVVRNAILLVLKLNIANIASRIIYGYLTEQQAIARNMNLNEYRKVVDAMKKAEKFFTNIGGKSSNFRNAVIKGRAAQKTGVQLNGLGAAATSTAAASGFIVYVTKLLSKIKSSELFNKGVSMAKNIVSKGNSGAMPSVELQVSRNTGVIQPTPQIYQAQAVPRSTPTYQESNANENFEEPEEKQENNGFLDKIKNFWNRHKKPILITGGSVVIAVLIAIPLWNKHKKKKKRQLSGIKAAKTRARNRRKALAASPKRKTIGNRKKPVSYAKKRATQPRTRQIGRGNTTVIRTPSKGKGKTRISKQSSKDRLSLMHAKAKQLQSKHPKTKYSKLLSMASKQI